MGKWKEKAEQIRGTTAPVPAQTVNLAEAGNSSGTCGTCVHCDLRNVGYCKSKKTVDALDGWDRIIVLPAKFGCVNWEKK